MKKNLLKGLVGVSILASLFGVNAETITSTEVGSNSSTANATVGSVQGTVYNIDISWGNFEYNWVYNEETFKYEWKAVEEYNSGISVTDNSSVKEIKPVISWKPAEKYDFVDAEFKYRVNGVEKVCSLVTNTDEFDYVNDSLNGEFYSDENCSTLVEQAPSNFVEGSLYAFTGTTEKYETSLNSVTPDGFDESGAINGPIVYSVVSVNLVNNYNKQVNAPKEGETIGTFTVTIEKK